MLVTVSSFAGDVENVSFVDFDDLTEEEKALVVFGVLLKE